MQTRFRNIDFFGQASDETLRDTAIFSLPVPHLSLPDLPHLPIQGEEIASFDFSSQIEIEIEIGPFPFENALYHFSSSSSFHLPLGPDLPIQGGDSHILSSHQVKKDDYTGRNASSEAIAIAIPTETPQDNACSTAENRKGKWRSSRSQVSETENENREEENRFPFSERNEGNKRKFRSETQEQETGQKENGFSGGTNDGRFTGLQFEIPELVFPLVDVSRITDYCKEEREISVFGWQKYVFNADEDYKYLFKEIPWKFDRRPKGYLSYCSLLLLINGDAADVMDDLKDIHKFRDTISYSQDVSLSIYSVEDITVECYAGPSYGEEEESVKTLSCCRKLLNFEVRKIGLDFNTCPSMEEEFHSLLSHIGLLHWVEKDKLDIDCKELLGSMNAEILECLFDNVPSRQIPKPPPTCLISLLDMDYVSVTENIHLSGRSVIYTKTSCGDFLALAIKLQFHEVEMLDLVHFHSFEVLVSLLLAYLPETWEQMLKENTKAVGNFYEFIINTELALVDDTFKSFSVPFLCEDKEILFFSSVVRDILDEQKVQHATACDGIYLDWHILQKEICNRDIFLTYKKVLEGMDVQKIATELQPSNAGAVIDSVFLDDAQTELNIFRCEEILSEIPSISMDNELTRSNMNQLLKDENQTLESGEPTDENQMPGSGEPTVVNPERISLLLESMSQFNELKFFLKARKGVTGRTSEDAGKEKTDSKASVSVISSKDLTIMCSSQEVTFQQWEIEVHHIKLSDYILDLIDNIYKNYFEILQNGMEMEKEHISSQFVDDFILLSLSKQMLLDLIASRSVLHTTSSGEDKMLMAYITLYACKQMAYYLCFFGIQTSYQYVQNLSRNLKHLRVKLDPLPSLIENACWEAEKGKIEFHPSLSTVEEILRSNFPLNGKKVLIVATKVFWWILKWKLTSMGVMFHEVDDIPSYSNQLDALDCDDSGNHILKALLQSDCLIISFEHIFPSFPFNKFSTILEYGGSSGSSRIATISPKFVSLPQIHLLKVELEEFSVPKALCEGFDTSQHLDHTMESVSPSMRGLQDGLSNQHIVELLNFIPIVENNGSAASFGTMYTVEPCHMSNTESGIEVPMKSEVTYTPSSPDTVIIVNTQNMYKEVLISRRSSYQKILAMEKGGVQVIERELNLPVDLIFSADTCLVWYDARNFVINGTSTEKVFSCIPESMENTATNVLMSLSFSFRGCIMVFEGDSSFLTAIMESSDGLYAAAASLDMQLQLYCSYSSDFTDEIIVNSIRSASKLNQGRYPAMLELETFAESFLTSFPSINPISAHAILSSGGRGTLVEFLECPHDQRIQAIGKYCVPNESMVLFSSLCMYGELGESKSGMTDCSSTLSSAMDSENCKSEMQSQKKRQKYTVAAQSVDNPTKEHFEFEPLNGFGDFIPKPSGSSRPHESHNLSTDYTSQYSLSEQVLYEKQNVDTSLMNDINWDDIQICEKVCDDFRGEALENGSLLSGSGFCITNTRSWAAPQTAKEGALRNPVPTKRFGTTSHPAFPISMEIDSNDFCMTNTRSRAPQWTEKRGALRSPVPTKRSSFDTSSHPVLPISTEIDGDLEIWLSSKSQRQMLDGICGDPSIESSMEILSMKRRENLRENKMQKSSRNTLGLSFRETAPPYGETLLSTPIRTSGLQQGSSWMTDFLNRVKEKSRMHRQSISCSTCVDHSASSRKMDKFVNRQSPSSFDRYRYQGGSKAQKKTQQKWPKQSRKSLDSVKHVKRPPSFSPTWTPIDKRARQSLSFTRSRNEKQSKLVWSDGSGLSVRKRYREED